MSSTGLLYAIGAAVTWGIVYTIDQRVLKGASPFALLFVDSLLTVILLLPIVFFERDSLVSLTGTSGKVWVLIIIAIILATLANFLIFSAIKVLGASTASIFEIAYPFFVVLFTYLVFRTQPSVYFLVGAALIFAGATIIIAFG